MHRPQVGSSRQVMAREKYSHFLHTRSSIKSTSLTITSNYIRKVFPSGVAISPDHDQWRNPCLGGLENRMLIRKMRVMAKNFGLVQPRESPRQYRCNARYSLGLL